MVEGILALIALYALFVTVFVLPIAYIWAWVLGPVWKHMGRKWAEGWFMVVDQREGRTLTRELYPGQQRKPAPQPPIPRAPAPAVEQQPINTDKDAGHAWLGNIK